MKNNNAVVKNSVTLNLIQDLQRLFWPLYNNTRGRFQIKFEMTSLWNRPGFTLIELLVVVLIISILAAVAVPQYQKAVLKSRFSSLMPTTQAIRDSQEAYYLTNSKYADEIAKLDVKATSTDDMSIDVGDEEETPELSYVIASRPSINNNLIMYQKHSEKFADNVHCEALKDNPQAQWLCETALHGEYIPGSIHEDYDTYLLSGTLGDKDYFAKECEGSGEQTCECGTPIVGTCNDKTGEWSFEGECPSPTLQSPVPCGSGYTGNKVHKAKCNSAGTAYEYYWDESGCTCPSGSTLSYGMCIDTTTWQGNGLVLSREVGQAIEKFYEKNGYYATSLTQLGLSNIVCVGNYDCHFDSDGTFVIGYKLPGYSWQTHAISYVPLGVTGHQPGNTGGGIYCWGSSASSTAMAKCKETGGTSVPGASNVYKLNGY